MRLFAMLIAAVVWFAAPKVEAAGFRFIDIPADAHGPALTGAVWSPCTEPPQEIRLRQAMIVATRNCPIAGERLPLIVMSHGSGGWFGAHRDTAAALADAGFVVAAIDHPGDNAADRSRIDTLSILSDRPVDIRRLTDFMLDRWAGAATLDRKRIGFTRDPHPRHHNGRGVGPRDHREQDAAARTSGNGIDDAWIFESLRDAFHLQLVARLIDRIRNIDGDDERGVDRLRILGNERRRRKHGRADYQKRSKRRTQIFHDAWNGCFLSRYNARQRAEPRRQPSKDNFCRLA